MLGNLITVLLLIPLALLYILKEACKGIVYLIAGIIGLFRKDKRTQSQQYADMSVSFDDMDGIMFEHYVAELLEKDGFKQIEVTKASGDFGVDIIAKKEGKTWVFQCKNYKTPLGVRPIQEVYAGKDMYHADFAVVVTNSYFTEHAKELARNIKVVLWDRDILMQKHLGVSTKKSRKRGWSKWAGFNRNP